VWRATRIPACACSSEELATVTYVTITVSPDLLVGAPEVGSSQRRHVVYRLGPSLRDQLFDNHDRTVKGAPRGWPCGFRLLVIKRLYVCPSNPADAAGQSDCRDQPRSA